MKSNWFRFWGAVAVLGACAGVRAGTIEDEIVLCIDISPSISMAELQLEIAGMRDCLNNTTIIPHDGTVAVGIVTYGHIAYNVLNLTPVTPTNLSTIIEPALLGLQPGNVAQTNITQGLQFAQAMLTGVNSQTNSDFILLAGDGAHNTGAPEPEMTCPQVRNAGTTICSIAIDASQSGENDLEMCAAPPDGQFGVAETFADFGPVCQACLAFFLNVECVGPTVCNDPGTCTGTIDCDDIADCQSVPGAVIVRDCTPDGPYARGVTSVNVMCTANNELVEELKCNVTVNDCEEPTITCPSNREISCEGSTSPAVTGLPLVSDNCGVPDLGYSDQEVSAGCGGTFVLERTWTAMDSTGNSRSCVQTITAVDNTGPGLSCPQSITLVCGDENGVPADSVEFNVGGGDLCDEFVDVMDNRPKGFFPPTCGTGSSPTIVNFEAMDDCGNESTCSIAVYVTGEACCPVYVEGNTDLTLMPVDLDVRQETNGPITTKASFDIWNSNEVRFSGTERCITCWDQTLLSQYGIPNHFLVGNLQTDKGKARINGIPSPVVCDEGQTESVASPLLGLAIKELAFVSEGDVSMRSASVLTGFGAQAAQINYDLLSGDPPGAGLGTRPRDNPPHEPSDRPLPPFNSTAGDSSIADGGHVVLGDKPAQDRTLFGINEELVGGISKKGSLLYFVKIELKWNAAGQLIQDTFVSLLNDNVQEVRVKMYQVNGDAPLDPVIVGGQLVERAHPGWNNSDVEVELTPDESTYWSAATGLPKGVSPFIVLDFGNPPGRPDMDPSNPGGRVLRGFLVTWAINEDDEEIRWNHLEGKALVINYAQGTAWEYEAWSFQCISNTDTGQMCDSEPGELSMDGIEYEAAPDRLLLDFFSSGSRAFSLGGGNSP